MPIPRHHIYFKGGTLDNMDEDIAGDMLRPIADAATIKQYGELAEGVQTLSIQPTGGLGRDPELPATMASDDHSGQQHTRIAEMAVNNLLQHRASNEENPASSTIKSFPAVINNALVFIEGADLRLEVGKKKTPCMVSSKALACASEIFMEMLYGEHSASHVKHIAGEWVVQFPEDDINAISILLSIIHGSPETVPMKLPIQNAALIDATSSETFRDGYADAGLAYLVALAADKYGLTHLLKPWAHSWLDEFRKADRWSSKHCGEILGAAWLLGDEDLLSAQLDRFVSSTWQEMDEQGQLNDGFLVYDTFQETHAWSTSSAAHHILNTMGIWGMFLPPQHLLGATLTTVDRAHAVNQSQAHRTLSLPLPCVLRRPSGLHGPWLHLAYGTGQS